MHKFTIFTIILSLVVVLVVAELLVNDYWGEDFASERQLTNEPGLSATLDSEMRGDEGSSGITEESSVADEQSALPDAEAPTESDDIAVDLAPSEADIPENLGPPAHVTIELFATLSVVEPKIETLSFEGVVYGFWDVQGDFFEMVTFEHKLFDGPDFIGTVYEIQAPNEIQAFGAYETLRQLAQPSTSGKINENNSYGDASFYFNHFTKTNTVYLVIRKGNNVYALQYSPDYHVSVVRPLIDLL